MGDEHDRCVDRGQLALQPFEALYVEVVRGLVEEQQVGIPGQGARERGPGQLSAGERGELAVEIGIAEAEAAEDGGGTVTPPPAPGVLEACLSLAVAAKRRRVVGAVRHRALQVLELLLDEHEIGGPREGILPERQSAVTGWPLVVQRDAGPFLKCELAALERRLADDGAQKRRLAGAVLARECEPLPAIDRERHPVEQGISGELLA